jgi:hypothetical protein
MKQLNKTAYNFSVSLILIRFFMILNFLNKKESKVMHESIPRVTIPPRDTPGNLPDRQFTGVGNLPFIYVHGGRVLENPGDLTNGCPESHPQILRQQNLVSGTHVGALVVFCALVVKVA